MQFLDSWVKAKHIVSVVKSITGDNFVMACIDEIVPEVDSLLLKVKGDLDFLTQGHTDLFNEYMQCLISIIESLLKELTLKATSDFRIQDLLSEMEEVMKMVRSIAKNPVRKTAKIHEPVYFRREAPIMEDCTNIDPIADKDILNRIAEDAKVLYKGYIDTYGHTSASESDRITLSEILALEATTRAVAAFEKGKYRYALNYRECQYIIEKVHGTTVAFSKN